MSVRVGVGELVGVGVAVGVEVKVAVGVGVGVIPTYTTTRSDQGPVMLVPSGVSKSA